MPLPLAPLSLPGLFVTGTDTGVGKTLIAAAIARWFFLRGQRVAALKPVATGCPHRREGLVSEDAEILAAAGEVRFSLDLICPNRYAEPLSPSVAARRAKQPVDWEAVQRSIRLMTPASDVMIVEGAGGAMTPADERLLMRDIPAALRVPAVVVARASLGTINHTLMTIESLRAVDVTVAGVVLNRYPTDQVGVAEETAAGEIERLGRVNVLAIVPDEPGAVLPTAAVMAAIDPVDWFARLSGANR